MVPKATSVADGTKQQHLSPNVRPPCPTLELQLAKQTTAEQQSNAGDGARPWQDADTACYTVGGANYNNILPSQLFCMQPNTKEKKKMF